MKHCDTDNFIKYNAQLEMVVAAVSMLLQKGNIFWFIEVV